MTQRADKVGILEKKKLRVFALGGDRTRTGRPPRFELLTSSRLWQRLGLHVLDVDADGRDDLVLLQPEGLNGKKLIVDLYRGGGGGRFAGDGFRSVLPEIDEATPTSYGGDWTGDGVPDLVAVTGSRLLVHAGLAQPRRKAVVEKEGRPLADLGAGSVRRLEQVGGWLVGYGAVGEGEERRQSLIAF